MRFIILLLLSLLQGLNASNQTRSELFIFKDHPRGKRAVLVNNEPNEPCRIYGHSNPIQVIENRSDGPALRTINQREWLTIAAECEERLLALNQKPTSANQIDFIYPGTKWCGTGDVAHRFEDLGSHVATDMCCRDHDFCKDTMKPGTCKYGLCNSSPFTKSHCDCDDQFRQCLTNAAVNDPASVPVGFLYFDVGAISCFRQTPDCVNKVFKEPIELTKRRKRQQRNDLGWCFIPPTPFKKPTMLNRSQPDLLRHVLSTVGDVTSSMVKRVATLSVNTGK